MAAPLSLATVDHEPVLEFGADPLALESGVQLLGVRCAYRTYGELDADRANAILIFHALTGDQYVAGEHPVTGRPGWWDALVGPGRVFDTDRYYVICANVLGGCMGTTGPADRNPETGEVWGLKFPVFTIADMVDLQVRLIDHLGIDRLFAVAGGSMGGMMALDMASRHPERVFASIPIATSWRHTAQNIAFHEVGRQAIMADPDWHGGDYHARGKVPSRGLAVARMAAHITYLSESAFQEKFGRELRGREGLSYGFEADFEVESYLRHQGSTFVDRFDANSYLYVTRAMDYFDMAARHGGSLAKAFADTPCRFLLVSFTSDWLFPTSESRTIVRALNANAADVSFVEVPTDAGHDSFLLDEPVFHNVLRGFLEGARRRRGLR